jgi:hypothetical protein
MRPMNKKNIEQAISMVMHALKGLGARSIIIGVEGLDDEGEGCNGAFLDTGGPIDSVAALLRGINEGVIGEVRDKAPPHAFKEFCMLTGVRVCNDHQELADILDGNGDVWELPTTSYRSKTIH